MTITANAGPLGAFGQSYFGDSNPELGPSFWNMGDMLLDPRQYFTYTPGQRGSQSTMGWYTSTAIPVIDQVPSASTAANIAASQAPTAGTALTLVSSSGAGITISCQVVNANTGALITGLLGIDVNSATNPLSPVIFGSGGDGSGGPIRLWNPQFAAARNVTITTNADDTGGTYKVVGYDVYGTPMTETVTGVNNNVASGKKAFKFVASVTPGGTINSTAVTVGTGDVFGLPLRTDRFPYISTWWGSPQGLITGGSVGSETVFEFPLTLANIADSQVYDIVVPFDGKVVGISYTATVATTTASKGTTFTAQANGSSVTGGVLAIASNTDTSPIGHTKSGTAITAANTFTAGQTVGFVTSSTTTFIEGAGIVSVAVQNLDASGGTFTAAVTTNPATSTTGDTRGTFAVPSASDGTKRLTVFWTPLPANMTTVNGLIGVPQA